MDMKRISKVIGLGLIFSITILIIVIFMIWAIFNDSIFEQNARNLTYIIRSLEDDQTVFLNNITPFEWDYLHLFGAYTPIEIKKERMGIDEQYFFSNSHDGIVYVYFLFENELVARMLGHGESYSIIFNLKLDDEQIPWLQTMVATPDDELKFLVIVRYLHDGRETIELHLTSE